MFPCLEVGNLEGRPNESTDGIIETRSYLSRRINAVITSLLFLGIEPDQITIDIDNRAVIVREDSNIHLRTL